MVQTVCMFCLALAAQLLRVTTDTPNFTAPAGSQPSMIRPGGVTVMPNGRLLTPRGSRFYGGENCWNIVLAPNHKTAALFYNDGLNLYRDCNNPAETKTTLKRPDFAFCGQFSPDGENLIVSSGEKGGLQVINVQNPDQTTNIEGNANGVSGTYINDLVLSPDGHFCYGVDVANQDLVTFDLKKMVVSSRVRAGREPYAVAISDDGSKLFIANIGIFNYSPIPPSNDPNFHKNGLSHPPFAFPSKESEQGTDFEGRHVPGIGSPNVPDAHSVFEYSLGSPDQPSKTAQANAGLMVQAPTERGKSVGASAPCALAYGGGKLFVANSNNDTVQVFDNNLKPLSTIRLSPSPLVRGLRGVIPDGLALDEPGKTLYVCEAGLAAIAVVDVASGRTLYQIPTGWFPSSVRTAGPGRIVVSCLFGIGQGPRGKKTARTETDERYGYVELPGMGSVIDLPTSAGEQASLTQKVLQNNGIVNVPASTEPSPIPTRPGVKSDDIKYVVYITKENHTYDGIFGGLENSDGEPSYAEWGEHGWIREKKGVDDQASVMPNHLKLARQILGQR